MNSHNFMALGVLTALFIVTYGELVSIEEYADSYSDVSRPARGLRNAGRRYGSDSSESDSSSSSEEPIRSKPSRRHHRGRSIPYKKHGRTLQASKKSRTINPGRETVNYEDEYADADYNFDPNTGWYNKR